MDITIDRDESSAAFGIAAAVHTVCVPDEPAMSGDELAQRFAVAAAEGGATGLWLARSGAEVIGFGALRDLLGLEDALLLVMVNVLPDHRHAGTGRALHDQVVGTADGSGPGALVALVYERDVREIRFAEAAGYGVISTARRSDLDLRRFDPTPHMPVLERVIAEGIEFTTIRALQKRHADWFERFYTLCYELEEDIPFPFPQRPPTPETFRAAVVDADAARLDGFYIAVEHDRWIGLTELRIVPDDPTALHQELTGVRREARHRGIATALKVHALSLAKARGFRTAQTWNDTSNAGIIAINDRLGFTGVAGTMEMTRPI